MATSDDDRGYEERREAERQFLRAMAHEAQAERAQLDKIKKGFWGCLTIAVVLFVIALLFF